MKKLFLLALLTVVVQLSSYAQDILIKTDGTRIDAKIEEITEEVIKYHRFDNLNGPVYTVPVTSVNSITFENGTVQTFNVVPVAQSSPSSQTVDFSYAGDITQANSASDAQLLKMVGYSDVKKLRSKAKKLKWATIIVGGGLVAAAGIVYWRSCSVDYFYEGEKTAVFGLLSGGVVGGTVLGIATYKTYKRVRDLEYSSLSIFEGCIYESRNIRLNAGLNMLANDNVRNNAIGLGFTFTF